MRSTLILSTALLIAVCFAPPADAAPNVPKTSAVYLQLDGIPGESTDHRHKGEIDLESFSLGETNFATPGHGGGMGAV